MSTLTAMAAIMAIAEKVFASTESISMATIKTAIHPLRFYSPNVGADTARPSAARPEFFLSEAQRSNCPANLASLRLCIQEYENRQSSGGCSRPRQNLDR
ncbi:hypothetical protein BX616_001230 [Lobosporangium transversale]|uniref:Secreted protein n=1 Tax=Lobosporangium transversale TaxID=64571 RepID=A0A1Y2GZN8_9FUNG|nr:hypothetical protein BCR41DRAFT_392553 [Lobosporangium transversale]KAF9917370.1 hypothetical protein BX616_001230 [Lobosporangium transversale]ORZ27221.1 hypothetical protein BCR41DRAFT_392553 [Lobosporangium transversale]|eukprot:XP_021884948.1 hypothetical protein BCR41DRAFT_392553 [Lobosporangium transversale]